MALFFIFSIACIVIVDEGGATLRVLDDVWWNSGRVIVIVIIIVNVNAIVIVIHSCVALFFIFSIACIVIVDEGGATLRVLDDVWWNSGSVTSHLSTPPPFSHLEE